jgi:hypothetical protein
LPKATGIKPTDMRFKEEHWDLTIKKRRYIHIYNPYNIGFNQETSGINIQKKGFKPLIMEIGGCLKMEYRGN